MKDFSMENFFPVQIDTKINNNIFLDLVLFPFGWKCCITNLIFLKYLKFSVFFLLVNLKIEVKLCFFVIK